MRVCEDPDILNVIYIFVRLINLAVIVTIVVLVIMIIFDIIKMITSGDLDTKNGRKSIVKRIAAAVLVFLVPSILNIVLSVTGQTFNFGDCLNNSNREYISLANANKAEEYLTMAEQQLTSDALYQAQKYINKIADEDFKAQLQSRADAVDEYIEKRREELKEDSTPEPIPGGSGSLNMPGGYYETGSCSPSSSITVLSSEPNPSCAINYWDNEGLIDKNNYIYPKTDSGESLGAWPADYKSIPTQINVNKTYQNGKLAWPVTPSNGIYEFVYEHNGIDIMAPIGTPIYSPADGTLVYSEWGHTTNKGSDETAYSVTINLDTPISYDGKQLKTIFLTHMSGIVYRCSSTTDCNRKVKKGELLGFVGNAAGTATSKGYAPHLHMSIYPAGNYDAGLYTSKIEDMYSISDKTKREAGN